MINERQLSFIQLMVELISVIDERHRRAREHEVRMTFEQERRGRLALWREIDTETAANQKFLDDELASRAELQLAVAREQLAKMTVAWEARGLRQTMHMPVKGNRAFIDDHWKERVKCVAIGATGGARPEHSVVIIYDHLLGEPEDGRVIYTAGVPQRLAASLGGRHRSLPPPTFVAMGTNGRFFVKFADGTAEWEGDAPHVRREHMSPYTPDGHTTDKFNEQIKTRARTAVAVAFGQDDAFFIIQSNGGFAHSGNIPDGLYRDIRRREHRGKDLADVNLGPRGEWWVSWTDGTWAVGGHSRRCRDDLTALTRFVTWDLHERSSGALRRSLPDQSDIVSVYQVAVKAAKKGSGSAARAEEKTAEASGKGRGAVARPSSSALTPMNDDEDSEKDYYNLLQLMEEAACSRDANRTNLVVGGLVQHIVAQWRETFGRSVTTKFNCFFLLPFVDEFHRYLRKELQKVYDGEGDYLVEAFDLTTARRALQAQRQELINESAANKRLQGKFDEVSRLMRREQERDALQAEMKQTSSR